MFIIKDEGFVFKKYPPSKPCNCKVCINYCKRPGWWTPRQVVKAMDGGYAKRMMLEISPELNFGLLSPAFKGCEGKVANRFFVNNGCTFYTNNLCELQNTGYKPLECSFCHHDRRSQGELCHREIEELWIDRQAQTLIKKWILILGITNIFSYKVLN